MLLELIDIITTILSSFTWLLNPLNELYRIQVRNANISTGILYPLGNLVVRIFEILG